MASISKRPLVQRIKSGAAEAAAFAQAARSARGGAETGFAADQEASFIWPGTINQYIAGWALTGQTPALHTVFEKCRDERRRGGYVNMLLFLKQLVFCDGLAFSFGDKPTAAQKKWLERNESFLYGVAEDFVNEWLLCDNAAVLWKGSDGVPQVYVPDCENLKYSSILGAESLTMKLPKMRALTEKQKEELGPRYTKALANGEPIQWGQSLTGGGESDEHFAVRTRGKSGAGFVMPRLYSIFQELSAMELLRKGDWNAAWRAKDVIRQYKRGHEIKQGNLAGQPIHFLKNKQAEKIRREMRSKEGVFDLVTNFDSVIEFAFLDPKIFNDIRTVGLMRRIREWAGPLALLLCEANNNPSPDWMTLAQAEGMHERGIFSRTLETVLNDSTFFKGQERVPKGARLSMKFNPNTFFSMKLLLEKVRLSGGNAWASPQTARQELGYDNAAESERLKEAAADPKAFTPPFEAKQGMVGAAAGTKGGRPEEKC